MSLLDNDDNVAPFNATPRREVEVLASPAQVILDIRKDIQNFQTGGPRKELVEALRDQFVATRHQAAVTWPLPCLTTLTTDCVAPGDSLGGNMISFDASDAMSIKASTLLPPAVRAGAPDKASQHG
jgi:hypothetical protein